MSGLIPEDEMKDAITWLVGRTVARADQIQAMTDAELAEVLLAGRWTTLEVHEAGRRLRDRLPGGRGAVPGPGRSAQNTESKP